MTFKEKSTWVTLSSTIVIFGYYFIKAYRMVFLEKAGHGEMAFLFVSVIVLVIGVEVAAHIILTIIHRPESTDERDRLIDLKATRNAYYLLVAGVFVALAQFWLSTPPILVVHIVLFFFILAEILSDMTKLIYYRRGI